MDIEGEHISLTVVVRFLHIRPVSGPAVDHPLEEDAHVLVWFGARQMTPLPQPAAVEDLACRQICGPGTRPESRETHSIFYRRRTTPSSFGRLAAHRTCSPLSVWAHPVPPTSVMF